MQISAELPVALTNPACVEAITAELRSIVASIPFPIWPGRAKHAKHLGVTALMNALFRVQLKAYGWNIKPAPTKSGRIPDACKSFGPLQVALEVQLGNHALAGSDIGKFKAMHQLGETNLSCGIFMDRRTADMCARGLATFEKVNRLVKSDKEYCAPHVRTWNLPAAHPTHRRQRHGCVAEGNRARGQSASVRLDGRQHHVRARAPRYSSARKPVLKPAQRLRRAVPGLVARRPCSRPPPAPLHAAAPARPPTIQLLHPATPAHH